MKMKRISAAVAVMGLSACMGGGGSDVEVSLSNDFESIVNSTRTASGTLSADSRLTSAAQTHATDMFVEDYDSIFVHDNGEIVMIDDPDTGLREKDLGDLAVDAGYAWEDLGQLIDKGEATNAEAAARWENETCLSLSTTCFNDPFTDFGIAKAGSGSDQRWVMILATPKP